MQEPTDFARGLRQRETPAEKVLWKALRGARLDGLKFRRQHPVGCYFADFACESVRLVIELDGGVHDQDDVQLNDYIRQRRSKLWVGLSCGFGMNTSPELCTRF